MEQPEWPERKAGRTSSGPTPPERRPEERRSMSAFPRSHVDLLDGPLPTVVTTEMPNGRFQSTVVWFNRRRRSHPLLGGPLDRPLG